MGQEVAELKKDFNKKYGWLKMVKDIADYTNTSFYHLLKKSAFEVLIIGQMMVEESELNQIQSTNNTN